MPLRVSAVGQILGQLTIAMFWNQDADAELLDGR